MNAYWAIIKDSYREALNSRVLWILLVLTTLVLVAIVPLSYHFDAPTEFSSREIFDAGSLATELRDSEDPQTPIGRLWSRMSEQEQAQVTKLANLEEQSGRDYVQLRGKLAEALNGLLDEAELYDEDVWADMFLDEEATALTQKNATSLSQEDLARRNRLLIQTALPDYFPDKISQSLNLTYFGLELASGLRMSKTQLDTLIKQAFLPVVMKLLVGVLAIFAAVLVTAPIIPQMFDAGQLSLLLSKPVSRSLMFLAKFFGGCFFVLFIVAYFQIGLYLIAGLRFDIWSKGLLICIPIFLFIFLIYYAVSALSGLIWRNAIVSIVITILFWAACFTVGVTKGITEQFVINQRRISRITTMGDSLAVATEQGQIEIWDSEQRDWNPIMSVGRPPISTALGPYYLNDKQRIVAVDNPNSRFNAGTAQLYYADQTNEWQRSDGVSLPSESFNLVQDRKGELIVIARDAVYGVKDEFNEEQAKQVKLPFGGSFSLNRKGGPFETIADGLNLVTPRDAAYDPKQDALAVYSQGVATVLRRNEEGQFEAGDRLELEGETDLRIDIALGGNTLLVARSDGSIFNIDAEKMTTRDIWKLEKTSLPKAVSAAPNGRWFAILYQSGTLYLHDAQEGGTPTKAAVADQGDLTAASFGPDNQLLVAGPLRSVVQYRLGSIERLETASPPRSTGEFLYYFVVRPIHAVFPKPSELDNTITYFLTETETLDTRGPQAEDLGGAHVKLRPWAPVFSGLIFVGVVLAISCIFLERQQF